MSAAPAAGTITRLDDAVLIDGSGAAPVPDATVIVGEDGRVAYAGPSAKAPATPGASVIGLAGRTLLPGFFDCHVHMAMVPGRGLAEGLAADPVVDLFATAARLRDTLHAGVTTVRDLGGTPAGFRTAQERGLIEGPRLRVAGKVIGHTGGHADCSLPSGVDAAPWLTEIADTPDEVRLAARRVIRDGADVIKVCATGGMGSPHDDPDDEGLSQEEMRAAVAEGRRHRGRPVAAHAQGAAGIRNALLSGVASIEHGYGINDELCDLAMQQDAFVVPTLATAFRPLDPAAMPDYHFQKKSRWAGLTKENIARAISRGVRIAVGTDAGVTPHGLNLRELSYLVELGMDPMAAIVAGTRTAAQLLGLEETLGTLEAGKIADLVVADGDPLADIGLLGRPEKIVLVVQAGVVRKNQL
jgi:imidazolonepropionase-like amidohydrolase